MKLKQRGKNPKYPESTEYVWKWGEKNIPEWLSDEAKIIDIKEDQYILETLPTNTGGLIIKRSQGDDLVSLKDENSYIIYSKSHGFQSLTENQKDYIYSEEK